MENAKKYQCETCDFKCCKESDFMRHLSTRKHKILTNTYKKTPDDEKTYNCECGKIYKHRQSLNNHKKICNGILSAKHYILKMTTVGTKKKKLLKK